MKVTLLYYNLSEKHVTWTMYDVEGRAVSSGKCSSITSIDVKRGSVRITAGVGGPLITIVYDGDTVRCGKGAVVLGENGVSHGESPPTSREE